MLKTTSLIAQHQMTGAKLVDFAGWKMPLHYGSQIQEHHFVREDAGLFDVSHMVVIEITGKAATDYLRYLLANDVAKLKDIGKALYTCMLNETGGIIDDLIVYKLGEQHYRLVVNAGTWEKDWNWLLEQQKGFDVNIQKREDLAIIAVQGPNAIAKMLTIPNQPKEALNNLRPFCSYMDGDIFYSRTGYTGEDGFEIQIPNSKVVDFWESCLSADIKPCGLGARDTLRLEAGFNLYGTDMDETTSPLESNLEWTVAFDPQDRHFIGRKKLEIQKQQGHKQLVGLVMEAAGGVLRSHQKVLVPEDGEGEITSGTFSPTLGHAIALARIPFKLSVNRCDVEIRQKKVSVIVVQPPFVRKGKKVFKLL